MIKPRILVAEDDRYLACLVRQTLEGQGMAVSVAENGEEALFKADLHSPDIILLDVGMPVLDGLTVLKTLKADRRHREIPVLMLTAARSEIDVKRAISNGAADYLTKPFSPDQLIRRVTRLLDLATRLSIDLDHQVA